MERSKKILIGTDASGARDAARDGYLVMIVDVIDMSTSLESALDAGAFAVLGASPDETRAPVVVDPMKMGEYAADLVRETGRGLILIAEPRVGTDEERLNRCQKVIQGIKKGNGVIEAVLPNIGAETPKLTNMKGKIVLAVSDTGGVAYDAAFQENQRVMIGTVARTYKQRGMEPAMTAVNRALAMLQETDTGIAVIAASRNSMEDVLAAEFIANLLMKEKKLN
ncbi:MAG: hypothetical protein U9N81_02850 [Bacillota bacterium]|nr:hypothetical protein [Bacillota bacterium]